MRYWAAHVDAVAVLLHVLVGGVEMAEDMRICGSGNGWACY
jgi:hypothetical protein